jgi:outer membrane receptor for ferrienterochelin and colicins
MPPRAWFQPLSVFALMFASAGARSQDTLVSGLADESILFQEIPSVYGASKHEQKTSEAPSSVSIVTAADIQHYGYRTLADVLRGQRGFYTTYDRNYNYAGVRGFGRPGDYNSRLLLLVDGHRVNDNIYASGSIGTEFVLDLDLVDRIEIIRGPGSSLYGTGAFFGVINVITRRGRDMNGAEVSAAAGSQDTYKGRLSYGRRLANGGDMLLSVTGYHSNGQKDLFFPEFNTPATNNGIAENLDQDHYSSVFASTSFGELVLQAGAVWRRKDIPTASFNSVFNATGTNTTDDRQYLDLSWTHAINAQTDVAARLYYDRYAYNGSYLTDLVPATADQDLARGQWWGTELKLSSQIAKQHRVTVGTEYIDNFQEDLSNYYVIPFQQNLDSRNSSQSLGLYAQDEYRPFESLIFNVGLRYDEIYGQASSTNPRFAAIWLPRAGTALKLLYGTAFRAPNTYELYWGGPGPAVNTLSQNLQPEKIRTTELIWEQEWNPRWRSSASVYRYHLTDLISLIPDNSNPGKFVFVNSDPIDASGMGLEIGYRHPDGIEVRASAGYQDSEVATTGARLSNSPREQLKLNVLLPFWSHRLTAGMEIQYLGPRLTLQGNTTGGYTVFNFTLFGARIWKQLDLSASVYNLFGKRYFDPGTGNVIQDRIEQDGTTFLLKATCRF